jgi:hypothetical protein
MHGQINIKGPSLFTVVEAFEIKQIKQMNVTFMKTKSTGIFVCETV